MKEKLIAALTAIMDEIPINKRDGANLTFAQALDLMRIGYEIGKAA